LEKSGYMDVSIADTLHEDTDFVFRLAAVCRLKPGSLQEPVAMRRVHDENRVSAPRSPERIHREKMKMWRATYAWCRTHADQEKRRLLFKRILGDCCKEKGRLSVLRAFPPALYHRWLLFSCLFEFPWAAQEKIYWREMIPAFVWNYFEKV
jgi:hypothetical protein